MVDAHWSAFGKVHGLPLSSFNTSPFSYATEFSMSLAAWDQGA
jgi:hypothetical protein